MKYKFRLVRGFSAYGQTDTEEFLWQATLDVHLL